MGNAGNVSACCTATEDPHEAVGSLEASTPCISPEAPLSWQTSKPSFFPDGVPADDFRTIQDHGEVCIEPVRSRSDCDDRLRGQKICDTCASNAYDFSGFAADDVLGGSGQESDGAMLEDEAVQRLSEDGLPFGSPTMETFDKNDVFLLDPKSLAFYKDVAGSFSIQSKEDLATQHSAKPIVPSSASDEIPSPVISDTEKPARACKRRLTPCFAFREEAIGHKVSPVLEAVTSFTAEPLKAVAEMDSKISSKREPPQEHTKKESIATGQIQDSAEKASVSKKFKSTCKTDVATSCKSGGPGEHTQAPKEMFRGTSSKAGPQRARARKEGIASEQVRDSEEKVSVSQKSGRKAKVGVGIAPKSEGADEWTHAPKGKLIFGPADKAESGQKVVTRQGSRGCVLRSSTKLAASVEERGRSRERARSADDVEVKDSSHEHAKPKAKAGSVRKKEAKALDDTSVSSPAQLSSRKSLDASPASPPRRATSTGSLARRASVASLESTIAPPMLQPTPAPPLLQTPEGLSKSLSAKFEMCVAQVNDSRQRQWQTFEAQRSVLAQLDSRTRVPHLLIELRSLGFIEVCGKDTGGIYQRLGNWLCKTFGCQPAQYVLQETVVASTGWFGGCSVSQQMGLAQEWEKVCDANYICGQHSSNGAVIPNGTFLARGNQGENNMGKLTMMIVNFMTNECGWGLQLCDGGNLGLRGQIREQQIKFKAPHPLNLIAPHLMIELRQVGYIEINGPNEGNIHHKLEQWLTKNLDAKRIDADPSYCDIKYQCKAFKSRGMSGENNMGLCTMLLIDFMVKQCAWTLITCNGGNYGRTGTMREQQLVFRNDDHVQHGENHVMFELRDSGFIEINGLHDTGKLRGDLDDYIKTQWRCREYKPNLWEKDAYCDLKFTAPSGFYFRMGLTNNLGQRTIQLAEFMRKKGWGLTLCNGGSISDLSGFNIKREQQVLFTKARDGENLDLPLLMIELRAVPTNYAGGYCGFIEVNGPNTNDVYAKLTAYMQQTMLAQVMGPQAFCDLLFTCGCFRLRNSTTDGKDKSWNGLLNGESNFGRYTMRLCDFLVDHVGEWDLLVCNGNSQDQVYRKPKDSYGSDTQSVNCREQQLVFRYRPAGRAVFMASDPIAAPLGRAVLQAPKYWQSSSSSGSSAHEVVPATAAEKKWMQELLDATYKKKATRDRLKIPMADRLVLVSALRSEHPALWEKYVHRRNVVRKRLRAHKGASEGQFLVPKTVAASKGLAQRCIHPRLGNPTNESSSKADEYALDENTGGAYDGLFAMLVCRTVLGRAFVTEKSGDYRETCLSGDFEVVVGDREKAVGTYREFVLFHEGSLYPEYVALYRREYDDALQAKRAAEARASAKKPSHAAQPAVPKMVRMQVQVPKNVSPGDQLQVKTPSGTLVQVTVPAGVGTGQTFLVDAPD